MEGDEIRLSIPQARQDELAIGPYDLGPRRNRFPFLAKTGDPVSHDDNLYVTDGCSSVAVDQRAAINHDCAWLDRLSGRVVRNVRKRKHSAQTDSPNSCLSFSLRSGFVPYPGLNG